MRALLAGTAALALCSCTSHVLIPTEQRGELERTLPSEEARYFLRLSYYVTPFFGDASKRLLTAVPPDEVRLLNHPNGSPVNPGAVEQIVPAGAKARITKVEFPTAWVMAERVLYTPRTQPWIYLEVEGAPKDRPLILVLRPQIKSDREFNTELERYLSREPLEPRTSDWTETTRQNVNAKKAEIDMPADALEMAWGYPERKKIRFEGSVRREEWIYADAKRVAHLADGRVVKLEPR